MGTVPPALASRSMGTTSSMGFDVLRALVRVIPRLGSGSIRGKAGSTAGDVDRHGEADPDEYVLAGRVDQGGHDPDDGAAAIDQRPAGVPRVHRGVDLDEAVDHLVAAGDPEGTVEARNDSRAQGAGQ